MGIGFNIKEVLRNKGLTIKKLAEMSNIPVNTLYSITKRDSNRIDKVILRRISNALEVDPAELLGLEAYDDPSGEGAYLSPEIANVNELLDEISMLDGFEGIGDDGFLKFQPGSLAESVYYAEITGAEDTKARFYRLFKAFKRLNADGQQKAIERLEELAEIPRYARGVEDADNPKKDE